jgi:N-acetylglutamate synthase-like GNAT family acetyltransferase
LDLEISPVDSKFAAMNPPNYRVRRATLDDIGPLTALWHTMHFSVEDLGRRITEFQVVEGADAKLLGALGLQIAERQGLIHSEAFADFAIADELRPLLWERIQAVATNHGLLRLWAQEQAPFWSRCGLLVADAEAVAKLPVRWRTPKNTWLTLKLKEDTEALLSADKEFALFMESEKQRTQRAFQQARVLKFIATLIALAILAAVLVGAFYLFRKNPHLMGR